MRTEIQREQPAYLPYLIIVSVVALVAIGVLALNNSAGVEGAVIHHSPAESFSPTCVDTDETNDYARFGTVHLLNVVYNDYCQDHETLKQWYCASSNTKRV